MLAIHGLSHRYTDSFAIRGVTFDIVGPGTTGILGVNGAGKSTCLNIICGVIKPTTGDVLVCGRSIRDEPVSTKSRLGYLPQHPPLYLELRVCEYLRFAAYIRGLGRQEVCEAVRQAIERCHLSDVEDRLIGTLSGGYRQRVGIAQAIVHRPSIVVLDEPTNGLDPIQIMAMRELIEEIATDSSVLISTHMLSEVDATCSNVVVINDGRVAFRGSTSELRAVQPSNEIIAEFRTPPPMEQLSSIPDALKITQRSSTEFRILHRGKHGFRTDFVDFCCRKSWLLIHLSDGQSGVERGFMTVCSPESEEDPMGQFPC